MSEHILDDEEIDELERYIPLGNPDAMHKPLRRVLASHKALRDERDRLRAALQAFCDEVEMDAAAMAYKCGLGAGEWESFIDRTKLYKQYLAGKAALTPAGGAPLDTK